MSVLPKDAILILQLLNDAGIMKCDPNILPMLIEYNYSFCSFLTYLFILNILGIQRSILSQSHIHAQRMDHPLISEKEINLTIQLQERTTPKGKPTTETLYSLTDTVNSVPLDIAYETTTMDSQTYLSTYAEVCVFFFSRYLIIIL